MVKMYFGFCFHYHFNIHYGLEKERKSVLGRDEFVIIKNKFVVEK